MDILKRINNYHDIKQLNYSELNKLAQELREYIIEVVSKNGGHLASNLGIIELTLALLKEFNPPEDKIIWDVSHQVYPYKILTDRKESFKTLRQFKGISGFSFRKESIYDFFGAGHANTAMSAALGFAKARDLLSEKHYVIAVVGDGALTGGLSLEALNNIPFYKTNLIVILNDNGFSISENIGGLSNYLTSLYKSFFFQKTKQNLEDIVKEFPFGKTLIDSSKNITQHLENFIIKSKEYILFSQLGFNYFGVIDGHNIEQLTEYIKRAKQLNGPILLHIRTTKGKGYKYAIENPPVYHGVSPFVVSKGMQKKDTLNYPKAFSESLKKLAKEEKKLVVITPAMKEGSGLVEFANLYPDRFFDVGIAEQHALEFAAGLAAGGLKPVVSIYSTFLQRAYDMIIHDIALQNLNVIIAIDRAGIVGQDGPTHHGVFDISFLRIIPNISILAPKDENELQDMLYTSIKREGPIAIRYPRGASKLVDKLNEKPSIIQWGKSEILKEGKEIALLAVGRMVKTALDVWQKLKEKGVYSTVINMRFIKPLDEKLLEDILRRYKSIYTLEDNVINGGFYSALLEFANKKGINTNHIYPFGWPDKYIEHGDIDSLLKEYKLDADSIFYKILNMQKKSITLSKAI